MIASNRPDELTSILLTLAEWTPETADLTGDRSVAVVRYVMVVVRWYGTKRWSLPEVSRSITDTSSTVSGWFGDADGGELLFKLVLEDGWLDVYGDEADVRFSGGLAHLVVRDAVAAQYRPEDVQVHDDVAEVEDVIDLGPTGQRSGSSPIRIGRSRRAR